MAQPILKALLLNHSVPASFWDAVIDGANVLSAKTLERETPEVLKEICEDVFRQKREVGGSFSSCNTGGGVVAYLEVLSLLLRRKFEITVIESSSRSSPTFSAFSNEEKHIGSSSPMKKSIQEIWHPSFGLKTVNLLPTVCLFFHAPSTGKESWSHLQKESIR